MIILGGEKTLRTLSERLAALDTEVRILKTANKHLELEWEEMYDKVRRQMARMSKRSAIDAPPLVDETLVSAPDDGVDQISARIIALRGGSRKRS